MTLPLTPLLVAFPVFVLAAALAAVLRRWRRPALAALAAAAVAYGIALAAVVVDPVWEDNGSPETMVWPEHLFWAMPIASLVLLGLFVVYGLWQLARRR